MNVCVSGKYGETRNSCLLLVKKWNESRHLVFWSLGTVTGLEDQVRRLVAQMEGINTPNTPYLR
jgi:hypothetical protein